MPYIIPHIKDLPAPQRPPATSPSHTSVVMSALKRLLTGQHKLHKHHSLSPSSDGRIDYLDLEHVNRHERSKSKPPTPISASTPTYNTGFPISGSPTTQSTASSSASSSNSNLHHGRSRSRARAKHERAKSLDVRAAQFRRDSMERAERRKNSYDNASLIYSTDSRTFSP